MLAPMGPESLTAKAEAASVAAMNLRLRMIVFSSEPTVNEARAIHSVLRAVTRSPALYQDRTQSLRARIRARCRPHRLTASGVY
jgi:hypothetical protein